MEFIQNQHKPSKHLSFQSNGDGAPLLPNKTFIRYFIEESQQKQMGSKGAGVRTVQWTVANVEPSEQIKDASWSADRRGKRSGFYIAN